MIFVGEKKACERFRSGGILVEVYIKHIYALFRR